MVTICDRLHFYRRFSVLFKKLYIILQAVWGLYQLARECHQLQEPVHQLQKAALRPSNQLVQTSPLLDECVFASMTRPILICQTEESLADIIVISRDTGPSAGASFSRIRTDNSSRAFDIYHRTAFCQLDTHSSG